MRVDHVVGVVAAVKKETDERFVISSERSGGAKFGIRNAGVAKPDRAPEN